MPAALSFLKNLRSETSRRPASRINEKFSVSCTTRTPNQSRKSKQNDKQKDHKVLCTGSLTATNKTKQNLDSYSDAGILILLTDCGRGRAGDWLTHVRGEALTDEQQRKSSEIQAATVRYGHTHVIFSQRSRKS